MATQVNRFRIKFPDWYDDRAAYEAPLKGYLSDVEVRLEDGSRYKLYFIDPVRLQQTWKTTCEWGSPITPSRRSSFCRKSLPRPSARPFRT
jgi:hypothetical protein